MMIVFKNGLQKHKIDVILDLVIIILRHLDDFYKLLIFQIY